MRARGKIRKELRKSENPLVDSWNAFHRLRSLIKMLPKNIKKKVQLRIESFGELDDEDREEVAKEIGPEPILLVGGVPISKTEWDSAN